MRLLANRLCWLSPKPIFNRLSLACVIVAFICGATSAQVSFVQITDPHLYDDGQEANENKRAFAASVTKINQVIDSGGDYRFVVVTGDIGIEKLVKPLIDQRQKATKQEEIDRIDRAIPLRITGAALEVANLIAQSKVKTWLFLPGNNDLIDEQIWLSLRSNNGRIDKTIDGIKYYRDFVAELAQALPSKEVIDLCPNDKDRASGVYSAYDGFAFIGFNNASFKNNNDALRISDGKNLAAIVATTNPTRCEESANTEKATAPTSSQPAEPPKTTPDQLKYVQQVLDRIDDNKSRRAYIFYHIPDIDDPHPVLNFDLNLLADRRLTPFDQYALSSWFVDGCVRARWAKVVTNSSVRGLFAGHLHDWRRDTYLDFHWMATPDYPGGTLTKLYVCPPISVKRQGDQATQARGFQAVSIDGTGRVAVKMFWYDAASGMFAGPGETQVASMSGGWRVLSSVAGYVWGTIPGYLPFYLLVVVVLYAVVNGWKRATVVSPFHLPSGTHMPFGEHTVANVLRDTFVEIHQRANQGPEDDGQTPSGLMTLKSEGMKFEVANDFIVPERYAVEIKGLSREAIISFARKILGKEWIISGDVIGDTNGFRVLARNGTNLWTSGSHPATIEGLRGACEETSLRILGSIDTILLSAYTTLRASDLIRQKKLDEALELMKEAASLLPSNALIAYDLGVTHAKRGDNARAIAAFSRAVELDNNFPEALNNLGVAQAELAEYDKAIASYEKALSIRPVYAAALFNLGDALLEKKRFVEAIQNYQKALELEPRDPDILFNLAVAFHKNKQFPEAIESYTKALELTPDDPDILLQLGMSLFEDKKYDQAISVVRQADKLRPNDEEIQKTLADMLRSVRA